MSASQQRFAERARARRRRIVRGVVAGLVVVGVLVGVAWLVGWSPLLVVDNVRIKGVPADQSDAVLSAADAPMGQPLARVDTDAVADRVGELKWVADVQVGRSWPRTLVIDVQPRTPVAALKSAGGWQLVDADGAAYELVSGRPQGVPELDLSAAASDEPLRVAAIGVLVALPADLRGQLSSVTAESPDDVRLTLASGVEVRWGGVERSDRKAVVLVRLLAQPGRVYDVSAPDAPAVQTVNRRSQFGVSLRGPDVRRP